MKYSYYPGCTLKNKAKALDDYARACALTLGFELEELDTWQCCGGRVSCWGADEIATKAFLRPGAERSRRKRDRT